MSVQVCTPVHTMSRAGHYLSSPLLTLGLTGSLTKREACHFPLPDKQVLRICLFLPFPHAGSQACAVMHSFLWVLEIQTQILMLTEQAILSNKLISQHQACLFVYVNMAAHLNLFLSRFKPANTQPSMKGLLKSGALLKET